MSEMNLEALETRKSIAVGTANVLVVSGEVNEQITESELWLPDGRVVRVPTAVLIQRTSAAASDAFSETQDGASDLNTTSGIIPLVEERLEVGKRTVITGTVRLQKTVQEYHETLDEPLAVNTFDIERVMLNRPVDSVPGVRTEGDTTVYPVVEEQLVLTKHLVLKEEVRVTRRETERRDTRVVTLRREGLVVEREGVPRQPGESEPGA